MKRMIQRTRRALIRASLGAALAAMLAHPAAPQAVGPSGLPLPRFVSLKSDRVNVRVGPGETYDIAWQFVRSKLPVEVTAEFENWRKIRDSDGEEGWVFQSLLSGERTVVMAPNDDTPAFPLRQQPSASARIAAYLSPGVLADVEECREGWCEISGPRFEGWIQQDLLWGVYPNEVVE
jgi:SH3-like domain-containing protein